MPHLRPTSTHLHPEELEPRDVPTAAPFQDLPVLPPFDPVTAATVRRIVAVGQQNGLRPDVFMKIGDSNTDSPEFARILGSPQYSPLAAGMPTQLFDTWAAYRTPLDHSGTNSFTRASTAAHGGWMTLQMIDHVPGELSTTHASVALVLAGTNDLNLNDGLETFRGTLIGIVNQLVADGVVPVMSTIPWNRYFGDAYDTRVLRYNQAIADIAADRHLPMINLWRALEPLANAGLKTVNPAGRDMIHLSVSPRDPGGFTPFDLAFGQNLRMLLTLQTLDTLREVMSSVAPLPTIPAWTPLAADRPIVAAGPQPTESPYVTLYDAETGQPVNRILAYDPALHGGVNVAVGDVNADGVPDVVTAPASGGGPHVRAFSGADGRELFGFFAFDPTFTGGVRIAVGDADGDGVTDVVVGAGVGGGPRVRIVRTADLAVTHDLFAFEPTFRGGVTVAAGNFHGHPGIAVGAGSGGAPVVHVFDGATGDLVSSIAAYDLGMRTGVSVAAGDTDGDGSDEVITGPGQGGAPQVRMFDPMTATAQRGFFAGPLTDTGGLTIGVLRRPGSVLSERIVTGTRTPNAQPVGIWTTAGERIAAPAVDADPALFNGAYVDG